MHAFISKFSSSATSRAAAFKGIRGFQDDAQKSRLGLWAGMEGPAHLPPYLSLLQECIELRSLALGRQVHAYIVEGGFEREIRAGNYLINMYVKCGSIMDARRVFDGMDKRDVGSWNAMISGFAWHGHRIEALKLFDQMQKQSVEPNKVTYISVLNACDSTTAHAQLKLFHARIVETRLESDVITGTALVNMYCKCSNLGKAHRLLEGLPMRDTVSWNVMIGGYAKHGEGQEGLKLFYKMQREGLKPDKVTLISILNICAGLNAVAQGKLAHAHIVREGWELDANIGKALINMYRKCSSMGNARYVFDNMLKQDVVSWTAMIAGHAEHGPDGEALKLFYQMLKEGVRPNEATFIAILNSFSSFGDVGEGKLLHAYIVSCGLESDVIVGTSLVNMYSKCGNIDEAFQVFSNIPHRDLISWNSMITGCTQHAHGKEALKLFQQMQKEGVKPDKVTFISVLNVCASLVALMVGKTIHAQIVESGMESDIFIGNALIDMYAKGGSIEDACRIFHRMPMRDVVSCNTMIAGLGQSEYNEEALSLFWQMHCEGLMPDRFTFSTVLSVCASLEDLAQGRKVHLLIIGSEFEKDTIVGNSLIDMYAKCQSIQDAHRVFQRMCQRDVVSWNAMISGFARAGHANETLDLFHHIECLKELKHDQFTFATAVNACASVESLAQGKEIFPHIIKTGSESKAYLEATKLDMYAKYGMVADASHMLHQITKQDLLSLNMMVAGCAQNVLGTQALELFDQMQLEGMRPDNFTLSSVLSVCANQATLARGKEIHAYIIKNGFELDVFVGSALVDMYAKSGCMENAWNVFGNMHTRNVASWNAMIAGCAKNGCEMEALELFEQMQEEGVKPDDLTFRSILTACRYAGLVNEGHWQFDSMSRDYGIMPSISHYGIMVDLFGRAGCLQEADGFIKKMPLEPNIVVWMSLLGACRNHGDGELAEYIVEHICELEPERSAGYLLIANIYAASGRWSDHLKVRKLMKGSDVKVEVGYR